MRTPARTLMAVALAGLMAGMGCQSTPAPVAGEFTVNLTTPNSDDGAILVRITGTGGESVVGVSASCGGCKIFSAAVSATEVKAVITGTISAGAVARVSVSNTNTPSAYSVQLLDVASRTYARRTTTGYSLTLQ